MNDEEIEMEDFVSPERDESTSINEEKEGEKMSLLYDNLQSIGEKDVKTEERASRDLRDLIGKEDSGPILLNHHASSLQQLMEHFLDELENQEHFTPKVREEMMYNLFTHTKPSALSRSIYHSSHETSGEYNPDPFIVTMVDSPNIQTRHAAYARLKSPLNTGRGFVEFVVLIITPTRAKGTKDAYETAATFAAVLSNQNFRHELAEASTVEATRELFSNFGDDLRKQKELEAPGMVPPPHHELHHSGKFMGGLIGDVKRRLPWYWSDIKEGFVGHKNFRKTIAAAVFLFMIGLLPSVAFGVLADRNTDGAIGVEKMIYSQGVGGLCFALFSGQPLVILDTTAPIALYIRVIYEIADDSDIDFFGFYAWVGIWNAIFLIIYAVSEAGVFIRYSTIWVEETFAFFIAIAFAHDAIRPLVTALIDFYYDCNDDRYCNSLTDKCCERDEGLLWIILQVITASTGVCLYLVRDSILFTPLVREFISDYSLMVSVLVASFFGSFVFQNTELQDFPETNGSAWSFAALGDVPGWAIGASAGLGFVLSLLFFMDQNISSAIVNSPSNKLRKGHAYHLDLAVVGIINGVLSLFGLPWLHGALPHSPLHVQVLADHEIVYVNGHITERVVHVRETRVSAFLANSAILLAVLCVPTPLNLIPVPVLYGVFLTLSITSLFGNSLWDRLLLIFTQQSYYPPSHYLRRVPQKEVHKYTFVQCCYVGVLCVFGFYPEVYVQILLPVIIILELPFRHFVLPRLFRNDDLIALDSEH